MSPCDLHLGERNQRCRPDRQLLRIIGAGDHGYLRDTYGSFTTIDVPRGNNGTNAVGINNAGQFVGNYFAGGANHGFLRDIDGRFITIDFPGAIGTSLRGINNAGEIVGSYSDSSGTHGFVAKVAALTFAGTSGKPNCHGQSVAALARQFGNLDAAATALRFPSVQALQRAIRAFCKDSRSPEAVRRRRRSRLRGGRSRRDHRIFEGGELTGARCNGDSVEDDCSAPLRFRWWTAHDNVDREALLSLDDVGRCGKDTSAHGLFGSEQPS
jgi:hypothetical protein